MAGAAKVDVQPKRQKVARAGYMAVEAILHEHTADIAKMEGDIAQVSSAVGELKDTQNLILSKIDAVSVAVAKAPHVPTLRDIATNVGGVVILLSGVFGLLMWWNAAMFSQYAKPLESSLAIAEIKQHYELQAIRDRVAFLESALQFKPSLRDFAAGK